MHGFRKSRKVKNPINATCVKTSGLERTSSHQKQISRFRTLVTSNTRVKPYQRPTQQPHHRYWRLIHGELVRLASVEWRFMFISGEKNLEKIWKELVEEFYEELKWLNITTDFIWNATREREIGCPFTQSRPKQRIRSSNKILETETE